MDIFCKFLFLDPPYIADERGGERGGGGEGGSQGKHWPLGNIPGEG